jgi:hypothetical protein
VGNRCAVGGEELERATEAVDRVVQLRRASPKTFRVLVEVGDEPVGIAGISTRGQLLEKTAEFEFAFADQVDSSTFGIAEPEGPSNFPARVEASCSAGRKTPDDSVVYA